MKHHSSVRKFGRNRAQRKALLRSLAESLILRGRIRTTEAKAKELRPFVEKMITKGKPGTLAARRELISLLGELAGQKVINDLSPQYLERSGGYTRILKLTRRESDRSPMAYIEFV